MSTDDPAPSVAEQAIREAMARGEFDNLPGAGRPLPGLDRDYHPEWWAERFVAEARARDAADELIRTIRRERPFLRTMSDVVAAQRLAELNAMVAEVNRSLPEGERLEPVAL